MIAPSSFASSRLIFQTQPTDVRKLHLKQSYLLLTWFYYLTFIQNPQKVKSLNLFVQPLKPQKYTILKAPMAHKTWSKEQIQFKFYKFKISFKSFLMENNRLRSCDEALLFILLSKRFFPVFETNLLFMKNYSFFFYLQDGSFFNFSAFK